MRNLFTATTLLGALAASAFAQSTFVESPLERGVWFQRQEPVSGPPGSSGPKAASPNVTSLTGFNDPGAIIRDGNLLYVGNDGMQVTVIDATIPGSESVVSSFSTPVNPIDLAIVGTEIYVVDQKRDAVHHRPLTGSAWSVVTLPTATWEWTYGNICFPHPTQPKLLVIQMWENRIQVVDLVTHTLQSTLTQLHHLPTSIAFSGDGTRMAVLCTGLSAPSCLASGPNLAVFDANTFAKLYEVNLQGNCSHAIAVDGNDAFVVREDVIRKFDLPSGNQLLNQPYALGGRNAAHNGFELIAQDGGENVYAILDDLSVITAQYDVMFNSQIWFPPVEEMVALPAQDGRIFVTCRNDNAVSIVHHDAGCYTYGVGCAGSGGFTPALKGGGCPHLGQTFTLTVLRGLGGAPVFFFGGTAQAQLPLGGGCSLLVSPVLPPFFQAVLAGSGAGSGSLSLTTTVPGSLPVGLVVTLQAICQDPGALTGISASNGVRLEIK